MLFVYLQHRIQIKSYIILSYFFSVILYDDMCTVTVRHVLFFFNKTV